MGGGWFLGLSSSGEIQMSAISKFRARDGAKRNISKREMGFLRDNRCDNMDEFEEKVSSFKFVGN